MPVLTQVAALSVLLTLVPAQVAPRQEQELHARVGAAAVRITFRSDSTQRQAPVPSRLEGSRPLPLGGGAGAAFFTTAPVRLGPTVIESGRFRLSVHRDRFATWLHLEPIDAEGRPRRNARGSRVPLEVMAPDSMERPLGIQVLRLPETAETLVFSYDTVNNRDMDRYRISTEANRDLMRVEFGWGTQRWAMAMAVP
jgi:hypothetical protein